VYHEGKGKRKPYGLLVGLRTVGRSIRRLVDNIKMDLVEKG
jgi:hypothetical protein